MTAGATKPLHDRGACLLVCANLLCATGELRFVINPFARLRYQRTRSAVAGYPLYDVPHKRNEGALRRHQIDENLAYFMQVRLQRLSFFRSWLADRYGIDAPLNGDGVLAVEKWADLYTAGLVPNIDASSKIFTTYQPSWIGENRGYNVLVDIAIFLGEFLISRRPHLHWTIRRAPDGGLVDSADLGIGLTMGRPELGGYCIDTFTPDLFLNAYLKAISSHDRLEIGGNRLRRICVSFAWLCRESLHVATHRDPRASFTFGDYSHGPL